MVDMAFDELPVSGCTCSSALYIYDSVLYDSVWEYVRSFDRLFLSVDVGLSSDFFVAGGMVGCWWWGEE